MSDAAITTESNNADPLRTAADAMALAVQAARDGAADARARAAEAMPAIGKFLSRFTYTTCYAVSYGVVFPTMLLVRAVPKENALVHGLIDGSHAARDAVAGMGTRSSAAPDLDGAAPEPAAESPEAAPA